MPTKLKPSEEKATESSANQFHTARLRLTCIYAGLLATILLVSSVITYTGFSQRLETGPLFLITHHVEPREARSSPQEERNELLEVLILSNGLLLIIASSLSYWLAGITLKPIQESYERQRRFLGDASHELRTPLAVLKTNLENELYRATKNGTIPPELTINLEEINRMGEMLGGLLSLSRLDEIRYDKRATLLDLGALTQEVVDRLTPTAQKYKVELTYNQPEKAVSLRTNKEMLLIALSNLVKNAIFYNKEGGRVTISQNLKKGEVAISVSDTGLGIAEADLVHIFERFYRTDKSRSRETGGSGLGLSITQSIMHRLGGSVSLTSTLGKGTTATLFLPTEE